MDRWDFTEIATGLALRRLVNRRYVKLSVEEDHHGNKEDYLSITEDGWDYIETNREKFKMRKTIEKKMNIEDDIPF